jgi:hypothetical protein
MCQCADGLVRHYPRMVEDFLELYCGFAALMRCQMGFSAHTDGIPRGRESAERRRFQFVRAGLNFVSPFS